MQVSIATLRTVLLPTLIITFAGATACGSALSEPLQSSREAMRDLVDDTRDFIQGESLEARQNFCAEEGGKWIERLIISVCENGSANVESESFAFTQGCDEQTGTVAEFVCVHEHDDGTIRFNDGPSVPPEMQKLSQVFDESGDQSRYNEIFWEAGRRHDDCYHHSPVVTGKSKAQCDDEFLSDMAMLCADADKHPEPWFRRDNCEHYAAGMYIAVSRFGQSSFDMVNLRASLPELTPLSQALDVDADDALSRVHKAVDQWEGYTP